jgi:hypothetical protein
MMTTKKIRQKAQTILGPNAQIVIGQDVSREPPKNVIKTKVVVSYTDPVSDTPFSFLRHSVYYYHDRKLVGHSGDFVQEMENLLEE